MVIEIFGYIFIGFVIILCLLYLLLFVVSFRYVKYSKKYFKEMFIYMSIMLVTPFINESLGKIIDENGLFNSIVYEQYICLYFIFLIMVFPFFNMRHYKW